MRVMYDFKCETCEKITEDLVESHSKTIRCSCTGVALRMVSCPRPVLDGTSGDFPSASLHWAKIRENNARIKARLL